MRLGNYNEIVGQLSDVKTHGDIITLVFSFIKEIDVPLEAIPKDEVQRMIGEVVGLLNVDGILKFRRIQIKERGDNEK